jgi:hypothetical protein
MEKKGLKVIQRRIDILESRLARINVAEWNSVVYSRRDYCLHANLLLGEYSNRFYLLSQDLHRQKEDWEVDHPDKPFPDPGNTWSNDLIDKAWNVLETSYHIAEEHLPANDSKFKGPSSYRNRSLMVDVSQLCGSVCPTSIVVSFHGMATKRKKHEMWQQKYMRMHLH